MVALAALTVGVASPLAPASARQRVEPSSVADLKGFDVQAFSNGRSSFDARDFDRIKSAGMSAVRLWSNWADLEPSRGVWNQANLQALDTSVKQATGAGLKVILDPIHLYNGRVNRGVPNWAFQGHFIDADAVRDSGADVLVKLATRYQRYRLVVGIDSPNEPCTGTPQECRAPVYPPTGADRTAANNRLLDMYDKLFTAVRKSVPDRYLLFLEPELGNRPWTGANWRLLTSTRDVVLSYHDYFAGGDRTGWTAAGAIAGTWTYDEHTGYPKKDLAALERNLLVHVNASRALKVPLWIGEFGINPDSINADVWIRQMIGLYQKYGVGHAWWTYGRGVGLKALSPDGRWRVPVALLAS